MLYLFAAFCAVWIVIFFYLVFLARRQRALAREVEALRHLMEQKRAAVAERKEGMTG
ncbi:MAG: CcmD family protein [Candidatus Binatia bacterium]|nr:CcmD family protein [Candidatus Binatia bacterium]